MIDTHRIFSLKANQKVYPPLTPETILWFRDSQKLGYFRRFGAVFKYSQYMKSFLVGSWWRWRNYHTIQMEKYGKLPIFQKRIKTELVSVLLLDSVTLKLAKYVRLKGRNSTFTIELVITFTIVWIGSAGLMRILITCQTWQWIRKLKLNRNKDGR